jgi:glycosyltransferase involved in cell wall biosynthesis
MGNLALCVVVFRRTGKLANLLKSVDENGPISTVYVGDNGEITDEKRALYDRSFPFDLEVLDLEYDAGLARSRRAAVEAAEEPYLLVVDSDIEIPDNVEALLDVLRELPDLGGVGGVLVEDDRIRSDCYDLFDRGPLLVKDIRGGKQVESVDGHPFVSFDQIQNVALYRRACLADYCWDSEYRIGWEHTDFFLGHRDRTDWRFGVCPTVMFRHYPGGDEAYVATRRSHERVRQSKRYFLDKWGYEQVLNGQTNWLETHDGVVDPSALLAELAKHALLGLPPRTQVHLMNLRDRIRKRRGDPPF